MSSELEFINFTISLHDRLGKVIEKWRNPGKKPDILPEEEEELLHALHKIFREEDISFGNDNRDPGDILLRKK